jgi:Protein of unknown function (DUF3341)
MTPVLAAEFNTAGELCAGVRALAAAGITQLDAWTPYQVEGLQELVGAPRSKLRWIVLAAGLLGGGAAYLLQWWINVVDYPLDIGGRPYHSALAFVPITFEMTILCAGTAALVAAIVLGGLPALWQPMFEVDGFERATVDRFWLAIGAGDRELDRARDTAALETAGAVRVVWLGGGA